MKHDELKGPALNPPEEEEKRKAEEAAGLYSGLWNGPGVVPVDEKTKNKEKGGD